MPQKSLRCFDCKKMTRTQDVTVSFRGLKIKVFKPGMQCYSCFKKEFIRKIKRLEAKGYFKISCGRVEVDWEKCLRAYSLSDRDNTDWSELLFKFLSLGVMSYKTSGNYMIQQDGSQFCLHNCGSSVYFTEHRNALGFIDAHVKLYGGEDSSFTVVGLR